MNNLDQYIQRLSNIEPIHVMRLVDGVVQNGFIVDGSIAQRLQLNTSTMRYDIDVIATEIMWWGRCVAQTRRVWQACERTLTTWKAKKYLEMAAPDVKPEGWKKPSDKIIEASYRGDPMYLTLNSAAEEAEEAHYVCVSILEAFKAKRDMLKSDVYRARDGSLQRMSV